MTERTRICIDCGAEKEIERFPVNHGTYRRTRCSACYRVYNNLRKMDKYSVGRERVSRLKKYNMTVEQYEKMFAEQDGKCAVCGKEETRKREGDASVSALAVDHDHKCCPGRGSCGNCVRGLLCYRCNTMIGYSQDNPMILHLASQYLFNSVGVEV